MNRRGFIVIALALLSVLLFAACGDARVASSEKLVSGYLNLTKDSPEKAPTLDVTPSADGYYAVSMYSGAGGHLMLFKIAKDAGGAEKITAVCEGGKAPDCGYSVNTAVDGGQTIVFGDVTDAAKDFNKIEVTFSDGQKVTDSFSAGKGYIIIAQGDLSVKDFVLTGSQKDKTSDYSAYLQAGGSITRTSFTEVKAK